MFEPGAPPSAAARSELDACPECAAFWAEARTALDRFTAAAVIAEPGPEFLDAFSDRLRRRIINDRVADAPLRRPDPWSWLLNPLAPALALALALMGVVGIAFEGIESRPGAPSLTDLSDRQLITERALDLDPLTVDFLERSELFLRSFVKIGVADADDIEQSQQDSALQLPGIEQRREALAEFPPVVMVIDEYEEILRDIRNLPAEVGAEDLADIQHRIRRNGLVGRMKAYQPTTTWVAVENR